MNCHAFSFHCHDAPQPRKAPTVLENIPVTRQPLRESLPDTAFPFSSLRRCSRKLCRRLQECRRETHLHPSCRAEYSRYSKVVLLVIFVDRLTCGIQHLNFYLSNYLWEVFYLQPIQTQR